MRLTTIIMILLGLNIILYVGGVRVINDGHSLYQNDANSNFINNFATVNANTNTVAVSNKLNSTLPTSFTQSGGSSGVLSFIDGLGNILKFVIFLVNIIFTPIGIFLGNGLPWQLGLMIGVPLIVGGVVAIALFIRGIGG